MKRYEGPFWSEYTGYEMLDLLEGEETIKSSTEICRTQFSLPAKYLVMSQLSAGQLLMLDCLEDKVYEVDFEGGDMLLQRGQLIPRRPSFSEFLVEYFTGTDNA